MRFRSATRPRLFLIATAVAALALTGCAAPAAEAMPTGSADNGIPGAGPAAGVATTLAVLETIPVKGRAPKTGYERDLFGPAWTDDVAVAGGRNGCDTRNDILARDLVETVFKAGTGNCVVLTGTLHDPYTGKSIAFTRGSGTSSAVQIDHVVALSDAWQKGAQQLDVPTRRDFANDPRNLLAVDGPTNQQKSDGDAATWLPSAKSYRCTYVSKQVEVKAAYRLWVTQAEKDSITRVLSSC
ncbi:HNH endonuclease family protein [Rhodococcus daqingensis]|uniref:HNH endonuclease family protein n=1 Tax=Rhodococcus daqingensis TaxID=2479363 RepID=A0ABW2S587_9NOCA